MIGPARPRRGSVRRRGRPPIVFVAWVGLLGAVIGLGLLGRGGERPATDRAPTGLAAVETSSPVLFAQPPVVRRTTGAADRHNATRPPIGEDGVMGGLVFGTAWHWLESARGDRP